MSEPRIAQTSFRAASQPFVPGDRVVIDYTPAGAFDRKAGKIIRVVFKERPRYGKTPGWWVTVRCDPPKGIKKNGVRDSRFARQARERLHRMKPESATVSVFDGIPNNPSLYTCKGCGGGHPTSQCPLRKDDE